MRQAAENLAPQVGVVSACQALGVPGSSVYRDRARVQEPATEPSAQRPTPSRALSQDERTKVIEVLNSEPFQDCAPREVYATLLDQGTYLCSWRTMYRILNERQLVCERRNQLQHPTYAKPELLASAPNQLWSWDITKLRGPAKWTYYYLYVILDVYSRYVTGWLITVNANSDLIGKKNTDSRSGKSKSQLVQVYFLRG